jgi:hypothetical protein
MVDLLTTAQKVGFQARGFHVKDFSDLDDEEGQAIRIGRMGGVLRVRADAEGSRRAADGCRRGVRQAEEEAVEPALGTRQPRRP